MQIKFLNSMLFVLAAIFLASPESIAQQSKPKAQSGIYPTVDDYLNGKLSLANPCGKRHKIKLKDFWGSRYIQVVHEGEKYRFHKDSIYAYQDCKGKVFRFFYNYSNEYQILENKQLVIYSKQVTEPANRGVRTVTRYFFSVSADTYIAPLTLEGVKNAFSGNHALHNELDSYFRRDDELYEYDNRHKVFRINHILGSSTFLH